MLILRPVEYHVPRRKRRPAHYAVYPPVNPQPVLPVPPLLQRFLARMTIVRIDITICRVKLLQLLFFRHLLSRQRLRPQHKSRIDPVRQVQKIAIPGLHGAQTYIFATQRYRHIETPRALRNPQYGALRLQLAINVNAKDHAGVVGYTTPRIPRQQRFVNASQGHKTFMLGFDFVQKLGRGVNTHPFFITLAPQLQRPFAV